jgi:hypothetical protein
VIVTLILLSLYTLRFLASGKKLRH